jgi:hypothetical protein
MLKILALLLFTTSSFASTVILKKLAISGYVRPENSFVKECQVFQEGLVKTEITVGGGDVIKESRSVDIADITTIRRLNRDASEGKITEHVNPCDIGTVVLLGYQGLDIIELETSLDCQSRRLNISRAAMLLRNKAEDICGF